MSKSTFTDLNGVYASAISSGIKPNNLDLVYLYVPKAVGCAGVFTQHLFASPTIAYTKNCIQKGILKGCIINSGNANAITGEKGKKDVGLISSWASKYLDLPPQQIGVASTGIIGVPLPMDRINRGIDKLLKNPLKKDGSKAAKGIMTTDTHQKDFYFCEKIAGKEIVIAGITKGSGMIAPSMATTLSFLFTNATYTTRNLQKFLQNSANESLNMLSVDNDTSTNDMCLMFSNGEPRLPNTQKINEQFQSFLTKCLKEVAKMLATDGEGAHKYINVQVNNARNKSDAQTIAKSLINSPLVKTCIQGEDPNWGRFLMAIGKNIDTTAKLDKIDIFLGNNQILSRGTNPPRKLAKIKKYLKRTEIQIIVNLNLGKACAEAFGCDLTKEYVSINTNYS